MRDLDVNILDVEEAVYGSELILTYIVQEGIEIERDILNTIIEAKRRIKEGPFSIDFEIRFWTVFNKLTNQIKPVTILSLKSSLGAYEFDRKGGKKKLLGSQKAVFRYGLLAVITLFSLMSLQIYWIVGDKAVDGILGFFEERAAIKEQLEDLKYLSRNQSSDVEYNRLNDAYKIADQKLDAQYKLLLGWNRYWQALLISDKADLDVTEFNKFKYENELANIDTSLERLNSDTESAKYDELEQKKVSILQQIEEDKARQKMFVSIFSARSVLSSLQQYFLPLSYGLLGAITFILRVLSDQIHQHTYSYESEINFKLKLALGALAGMAVGWFFASDSTLLGSFSPLALAFLFGYNVDIFFALMDQAVSRVNTFLKSKPASSS